ncbi:aaa family atpase [Stylonychia lemnae]|uniref:Aaa family atpase n=1 Tax=Stylonychia lemnae TaxID=5949 RepID=A0A078B0G9_STYLE|nr:aaa family atpase [Stylonychia lemnae]|eukprot:CDW88019.1 aaa family atpase [Stylonychia lemnae]
MLFAVVVNICVAVIAGTMYVVLRKLKEVHVTIINGHYAFVIAFVSTLLWFIFRYNPQDPIQYQFDSYQYYLMLIVAVNTTVGNMTPILALKFDKASRIASVNFLLVLISYLGDVFIFGYSTHFLEIIGAAIIIGCSAVTMILKYTSKSQ